MVLNEYIWFVMSLNCFSFLQYPQTPVKWIPAVVYIFFERAGEEWIVLVNSPFYILFVQYLPGAQKKARFGEEDFALYLPYFSTEVYEYDWNSGSSVQN